MVMPLKKVPLSYEETRTLVIEALGTLRENVQTGEFNSDIARLACQKGVVPDPNGPEPSRHAAYFLDNGDVPIVQDIFWDLLIEGIVRPGLGDNTGNGNLPFFHLTGYGKEQVAHGKNSPHDPDGYLKSIQSIAGIDPIIITYVNEGLHTFRIGCMLSSAVMLGCASERTFVCLLDAYLEALAHAKSIAFKKRIEGKFIKTQFDEFNKMLQGHLNALLPADLKEGLPNILLGVFEMIRAERNDAGHPTGKIPERALVFANISVFRGYLKRVYDLIEWLNAQGAGGLP